MKKSQSDEGLDVFWFGFTMFDEENRRVLCDADTQQLLERIAGVKFSSNQFTRIIQALGSLVASRCMRIPPKSDLQTRESLARLRSVRDSLKGLVAALSKLETGELETLGTNVSPFRNDHPAKLHAFQSEMKVASEDLERCYRGIVRSFNASKGRPPKRTNEVVSFCQEIKDILKESGARVGPVGYTRDAASGQYKGLVGDFIQALLRGKSDYTDGRILMISDNTLCEILRDLRHGRATSET